MTEEHLIHVSRYIHINPYVAGLINTVDKIWSYPLSSACEYIQKMTGITNTKHILELGYFLENQEKYKRFVESQTEHGKTLALIKYSSKWSQ